MSTRIVRWVSPILVMSSSGLAIADDTLSIGERLEANQYLESNNGDYRLYLQGDGNVVLRQQSDGSALWSTQTNGQGGTRLNMQGDGNLVLYTSSSSPVWASNTNGSGADRAVMQGDGNFVIYTGAGAAVWSTDTAQPGSGGGTVDYSEQFEAENYANRNGTSVANGHAGYTGSGFVDYTGNGTWIEWNNVNVPQAGDYELTFRYAAATASGRQSEVFINGDSRGMVPFSNTQSWTSWGENNITVSLASGTNTIRVMASGSGGPNLDHMRVDFTGNTGGGDNGGGDNGGGDNGGGDNGGGGDGGQDAESTGEFSTPSAALYALNDSRQRGFPKVIDHGFGGNGHAETWDGRVFVRTRTGGWYASVFRPERISRNSDGSVGFSGAFANNLLLESNDEASDMQHNWLAIVKDPATTGENPYPSDRNGNYNANGTHATYKAMVYHTSKRNGDNDQMGLRRATFIVSNANTRDAQLIRADFTSSFQRMRLQNGNDFRCIEPSATIDGRLVICQGHPNNDGRIDNLVYSWNPTPGATNNWRTPKSLANMYWDDRNQNVAGLPFFVRFPIAEQPILDATGNDYARGELIKGAYPWISHDGSELFYQASRDGTSGRRTGTSVVGRWTGWTIRHIDGTINRNRADTNDLPSTGRRLFISSPGAFTTMWSPYKDVDDLKIPYSVRGPSYPIFGSNSVDYNEVAFDDYTDGNYILYYGMNEQLARDGRFQTTRTNDSSGNFNNGTLNGARFPVEFNGRDELVGRYGQAIYFNGGNYIEVNKNQGWDTLNDGVTVDFWVRKVSGSGTIRLFNMVNGLEVYLTNGNSVNAAITDTSGNRQTISGGNVSNNDWTHVAMTYERATGAFKLYVNANEVANRVVNNFGTLRTTGAVRVGPQSSSGLLLLDEVKVSNVARRTYEIAYSANVQVNQPASNALASRIPDYLNSLRFNTTNVRRFSDDAVALGAELFVDEILSKEQTTSCATCHNANLAFTDGLDIARGNEPTDAGVRNTPTLFNRLFSSLQGWSGQGESLDKQALIPIQAAHEMNLPINEAIQRLNSSSYANRFQQVYGEPANADNIASALASFQAIQFSPRNRVDDFKAGDTTALTASERRGLDLFEGDARCSGCHAGANFTDESFRNNGLAMNDDIGRAEVTGRDRDHKLFKVPSLRELGITGPYMHDGSIATLREVVEAYNEGALDDPATDTDMRPLELSNSQINDLVAFLTALSENGLSQPNPEPEVSEVTRSNGILVGGAGSAKPGFALYVFDNDQGSNGSNCNGGCATAWPPVLVTDSGASGLSGLSTITRQDGSKQAAYNGRPLYFFAQDTSAGQTTGDGVNGVWWLAEGSNGGGDNGGGDNGGGDGSGDNVGGEGWTQCANEGQVCNFSGTKVVAYGANGTFVQQTFTNGVNCNNGVFGDPVPGVPKVCYYQGNNDGGGDGGNPGGSGTITRHVWTGISGTALSALTSDAGYPDSPDIADELNSFEAPVNWAENYGTRVVGYLHAPVTGQYTFWIASDDNGELWLSTNDQASNKRRIAYVPGWASSRQWNKHTQQQSAPVTLQAGQRYYIEALQKEGGGGDNLAVAWQRPNQTLEVIPGSYLSPFTGGNNGGGDNGGGDNGGGDNGGGDNGGGDNGSNASISANASYTEGDTVRIGYANSASALDWIAVYSAGSIPASCQSHDNYVAWQYAANDNGSVDFNNLAVGSYQAQLYGDDGYCRIGAGINFTIGAQAPVNQPPTGSFMQPAGTAVSENIGVVVAANDPDGSVERVNLYLNGQLVRTEGSAPFEWGTANSAEPDNALMNLPAGSYQLRAVIEDNDGATATITKSVTVEEAAPETESGTFEKRISSSSDDAEEKSGGSVNTTSSDLELVFDGSNQTVGMRFTNVSIPQGATIDRAYIQFTVDETNSGGTSVAIRAQDSNDANAFTTSNGNITGRPTTSASVNWNPSAWNSVGSAGSAQRTPELKSVVQEVVNRNGWQSGNDLAFIVSGTGERTAESYDGSANSAPLLRIEYTYETDGSGGGADPANLTHVGSTSDYDGSGDVRLNVPTGTREGDLLMAFVSRTDDLLPIRWSGWTAGASCYKTTNGQSDCHEIRHCSRRDGDYCLEFNGGNGRDLATVVFYKTATANEPSSYRFNLRNSKPGWGILTTLRGADNNDPIRAVATESNDGNPDSLFPSVNGNVGDLLLLSMAFDDTTDRNDFAAPNGMEMLQFTNGSDEAGYLYSEKLDQNGQTGTRKTNGPGGSNAKDALIALTVKPGNSSDGGGDNGGGDNGGGDSGGNNGSGGDAQSSDNWLTAGNDLRNNDYLESANGQYRLYFQGDGNLVLREVSTGNALWSSGTHNQGGVRAVLQGSDGNFVIYNAAGAAIWASNTNGQGVSRLVINNDGSLALYAGDTAVWSQNGDGNTGGGDGSGGDGSGGSPSPANGVKIAFVGDTGAGGNFQNVLNLIKSEGAELTLVAGDTSYSSSRDDDWDAMVRNTLGSSDPVLVVAGNHDYGDSNFSSVRNFGQQRLNRQSDVQCSGSYAEQMTCNYKGVYFVLSAIGSGGSRSNHESFIRNSLQNAPDGAWRVCAWHKNQRDMQVGGKTDEVGWTAYEDCRRQGAIIATGHEHSYSRTHLLSDMSERQVASTSSSFTVQEGRTFAFVSGLGGIGIRDQERGGNWWASIYTSTQGARYGALFGTFYEDRAEFYFKNINGQIIDQFTVLKGY